MTSKKAKRDMPCESSDAPITEFLVWTTRSSTPSQATKRRRMKNPRLKQASENQLQESASPGNTASTETLRGSSGRSAVKDPTEVPHDVQTKETPEDKALESSQAPQDSSEEVVRACNDPDVSNTPTICQSSTTTPRQNLSKQAALGQPSTIDHASRNALHGKADPAVLSTEHSVAEQRQARAGSAGGASDALVGELGRREPRGSGPTEPDDQHGLHAQTSPASSSCDLGFQEEGTLHKLQSPRRSTSLPLADSPDRMLGKLNTARQSTSMPMMESYDRRSVRFEQPCQDVSETRKKSRRKYSLFPWAWLGSRTSSGSALTFTTSTPNSQLRLSRSVPYTPHIRSRRGAKPFCRPCTAMVVCSAVLLLVALIAGMLIAGWRLGAAAVCRTKPCLEYARLLADSVNTSVNPCAGFTRFVCSGWRRRNRLSVHDEWMMSDLSRLSKLLRSVRVPRQRQDSLQKAAAFLRSCEAVRNGDVDEMPKVKAALLEAGIVWPLLPGDSDPVDVLRTWLHTCLRLRWSSVLDVSIRRDTNTTVIFLEPLREFLRIAERHEKWAHDLEEAQRYFETLRREFLNVTESPANETEGTVSFSATNQMDTMYLRALQETTGFLSNYSTLDPAEIFGTVPSLTRERWLAELSRNGVDVSEDVVFASTKPGFVRTFLALWKYRGEREMHLFLSWCTVQTVALYANRRLLVNFYERESSANVYHAALCLSKAYLLCGSDLFVKYFQDVLSEPELRAAQRVVAGTRHAFASRLERWQYRDDNITLVEDWHSTDIALGYFDPLYMQYPGLQTADATCTRDLGDSLVDNMRLASMGHVPEAHRWVSEQIEHADWFVLMPGKDLALLPYALTFPWLSEVGTRFMNHGGLGGHVSWALSALFLSGYARSRDAVNAIIRVIESANKASRPSDVGGPDRIVQILRTLALDVSYDAYRAAGVVEGDEHLEGFEGYGAAAMFFIASCYALCRGSDTVLPFAGAECDETFRNVEGFGNAFGCELGSAMNPSNKTALM
ncbi:endothelin-converting enzyme-like 1 isoform X2 [Dermacentor albipictus]|uniref:endothelin-converting enzyme-like 1 isoform X2 n=1 Tax=Dermacentor albipictus TaxID=60249 RepID=UPI0038FC9BBB